MERYKFYRGQTTPAGVLARSIRAALTILAALPLAVVLPGKLFAQAPTLSYNGPQTYTLGVPITPLSPVSSGVAGVGYHAPITIASGFNQPFSIATDGAGNLYVASETDNSVVKVPAGGGIPVTLGTGFNAPRGIAVDFFGDVYVADTGNSDVTEIYANGSPQSVLNVNLSQPTGVAVDQSGVVYVSDMGYNTVSIVPIGGAASYALSSGFSSPSGVAVDVTGNVFVADRGSNTVQEIPVGSTSHITYASGFNNPTGIAIDASGNLYVADYGNNAISRIPAGGGTPVTISSGLNMPYSVAVDNAGNVYVADEGSSSIKKIQPSGGYYIAPALSKGLVFDSATGIISGNPLVGNLPGFQGTNYSITAYNNDGSGTANLNILVNTPITTVSYNSPEIYYLPNAITPITPTSSGVNTLSYDGGTTTIGSGFSLPYGIAVGPGGQLYIGDSGNDAVKRFAPGDQSPTVISSGFNTPTGVATDPLSNDVYVADFGNNAVKKIPGMGFPPITLGSGFSNPVAVALDAANNVYVADKGNNAVKKILAGTNTVITLGSGFIGPSGVAVDAYGNVFVADYGNNAIKEIPAGGGAVVTLGSGFSSPEGVAVDCSGNVFVADNGNNAVKEISAGSNTPIVIGSGFNHPAGISVDGMGNVFVADQDNNAIKVIRPIGGYFISPTLPAGLTFNNATGVVSGTPVVASPATLYTVTACNASNYLGVASGTGTGTFKLTVYVSLPTVEYNSPEPYITGTAITPLVPTVTGMPAPGYSIPVILGTGYSHFSGLTADSSGNVYLAIQTETSILKIPPDGGPAVPLGSGFNDPTAVAVDRAGNLYVADAGHHAVMKIPAGGGAPITLASGVLGGFFPYSIAVDAAGNVFEVDQNNSGYDVVRKIPAGGGSMVVLTELRNISGIAVDAAGNVYGAIFFPAQIFKIPAGGGSLVTIGSGFTTPAGIAADAAGNVYVSDTNLSSAGIYKIPADGSPQTFISPGFATAVDNAGNLYEGGNSIKEIRHIGVYTISPALPTGLIFDGNTGVISGTPSVTSQATDYSVIARNAGGTGAAVVNIKTIPPYSVRLSHLGLSRGELSPAFSSLTTGYTAIVGNATTSTIVTPTVSVSTSSVTVDGNVVISGQPSQPIMLSVGRNVILVKVTAQDSTTAITYTITVNRAAQTNANLSLIKLSAGQLSPSFSTATTSYTSTVSNGVTSITVTPTTSDTTATVTVNGNTVRSGSLSSGISLNPGINIITVLVTAQDGTTTKTYALNVTRTPLTNAKLSGLTLSNGALSPAFTPGTLNYATTVGNAIAAISITPITSDPTASVTINGASVTSGIPYSDFALSVGPNIITILVTAQDGITTKTYTVTVTRTPSTNASLGGLNLSTGIVSPVFNAGIFNYTAAVSAGTDSVQIFVSPANVGAAVKINGVPAPSGMMSVPEWPLNLGPNIFTIVVTAQDGVTTKTYTLTVTRSASTNASLSTLGQSIGGLKPAFSSGTTSYALNVGNAIASITLKPVSSDANAIITVNGTAVASGTTTAPIALSVGLNSITTVVTAQNGTTTKTYTLTVTRAPSANAGLSNIKLSNGTLTPAFATATSGYTAGVANSVSTITITPTTTDASATIKVNGTAVSSGAASGSISLAEGAQTIITMVVAAQDGSTTKTYTVTVTRAPSTNANLYTLGQSVGGLTPAFSSTTTSYTENVSNATATMTLKPVSGDANAAIKVNGTAVTSGTMTSPIALSVGANTITTIVTAQNGTTTKTYTLTVTRASGSADNYDPTISVTKPTETVLLAGDGIVVHQGVSPNGDGINDFLQIDNISQYADNKLMIMNRNGEVIYEAKGYDNSSKVFDGHSNKNGQMQLPGT